MDFEKQKKLLLSIAYYGIILLVFYLFVRYLVPPLTPFLIGFLVAWLLHKPAAFLVDKLKVRKGLGKLPALFLTIGFYVLVIGILVLVGSQLGSMLGTLLPQLPGFVTDTVLPMINKSIQIVKEFLSQYDFVEVSQLDSWFSEMSSEVVTLITSFSTTALRLISGVAAAMPNLVLKIVLTVISTFYFSLDYDRILSFFLSFLPEKTLKLLRSLKEKAYTSLGVFIRSYFLVFLLTFAELSLGFAILQLPYPAFWGFIVAVVDVMPVLGTGLVLLPWSVICLILGNYFLGIGLLVLYVAITAIRNVVEPKLVGNQIGLHPLATLISMFVGLQLFGLLGLFIFPVGLSILVQFKDDVMRIYRKLVGMEEPVEEGAQPDGEAPAEGQKDEPAEERKEETKA